jgi:hypothetical protein
MKNTDFWDVTPFGSVRSNDSEERIASIIRAVRMSELSCRCLSHIAILRIVLQLLVTANVPSSLINFTLMMDALILFVNAGTFVRNLIRVRYYREPLPQKRLFPVP